MMHAMKVLFLTASLSVLMFCCYGQTGKSFSGDTTFWYKYRYDEGAKIGVKPLIKSTDQFHFRFWKNQQEVDIWTEDGVTYAGSVISYTRTSEPYDLKRQTQKKPKYFFKKVPIDSATAKKAFLLIQNVLEIPSDKAIQGWEVGLDGDEYNFEISTLSSYSFKNYWTPTAQKNSLMEAKEIEKFTHNLDTLLQLKSKFSTFFKQLKPGNYTGDGPWITMKFSNRQQEFFKKTKPYREYLKSISDTLNHYLSNALTKVFSEGGGLACSDEFVLTFSKDNKLFKVSTNTNFDDKYDKKEFETCKKKIIKAFDSVKIDFVHSQIGYVRWLTFSNGKAVIVDREIY